MFSPHFVSASHECSSEHVHLQLEGSQVNIPEHSWTRNFKFKFVSICKEPDFKSYSYGIRGLKRVTCVHNQNYCNFKYGILTWNSLLTSYQPKMIHKQFWTVNFCIVCKNTIFSNTKRDEHHSLKYILQVCSNLKRSSSSKVVSCLGALLKQS